MIYTAVDNFYLGKEQLENSPSRADGISFQDEQQLRLYACNLINKVGILLKCPQQVLATAQVLLHRFYCKKSFRNYLVRHIAVGCLLLASKLEEVHQDVRNICLVTHRVLQLEKLSAEEKEEAEQDVRILDLHGSEYVKLKSNIFKAERHILKNLQFIMHVDHPHKFTLTLLKVLFMGNTGEELLQEAWNLANDSLRTTLCVQFKSNVIACGIVYLASKRQNIVLPEQTEWWTICGVHRQDLISVVSTLQELYVTKKPQYLPVYYGDLQESKEKISKVADTAEESSPSHSSDHRSGSSTSENVNDSGANKSDSDDKQSEGNQTDPEDHPPSGSRKRQKISKFDNLPPPPPREPQSRHPRREDYRAREQEYENRGRSHERMGRGRTREDGLILRERSREIQDRSRSRSDLEERGLGRFGHGREFEQGEISRRRIDFRSGSKYSRSKDQNQLERIRERDYRDRRRHQ